MSVYTTDPCDKAGHCYRTDHVTLMDCLRSTFGCSDDCHMKCKPKR